jgi:predicted peroxiredoxin
LLRVKRRHDLEDDKAEAVWLECGSQIRRGFLYAWDSGNGGCWGKLIKGLKNSYATGVDFIDTRTIKLGAEILAPAIQHISNLSISTSTYPDLCNWYKVAPLLKVTDCGNLLPKSYRPVALLPVFSKILEKAVFNQLVQYLDQYGLVHPNLHGSRAGHSTSTALNQLYDTWVEEVEQGNMVGVLLCDQSAAFDLSDHHLLTEKLKIMGVEDRAATWFWSYLSGRRQSCMVDGHLSAPLAILPCGVPQSSIGVPILWLIFTCDQPDVIHDHQIDRKMVDRGCSDRAEAGKARA